MQNIQQTWKYERHTCARFRHGQIHIVLDLYVTQSSAKFIAGVENIIA